MCSHLTAAQRDLLRRALVNNPQRLDQSQSDPLGGLDRGWHDHQVLTDDGDEICQHGAERAMNFAVSDRELQAIGARSAALRRVDTGAFGQCADCGEAIPFARFHAEAWALRCVACEGAREARVPAVARQPRCRRSVGRSDCLTLT